MFFIGVYVDITYHSSYSACMICRPLCPIYTTTYVLIHK